MSSRLRFILSVMLWLGLLSIPALAKEAIKKDELVLFEADQLINDQKRGIITAKGHVELAQGGRILLADTVSFNQKTNVVTAYGNIKLREPTGDVVFADTVELTKDLRDGFIKDVRILLTDNSRMAANSATRTGGTKSELSRVVYSPCDLCQNDPSRAPLWQIKAERVIHDQETQDIVYHDAQFEFYGVPVAYLPYFSHPDPTVKRRSGFLTPSFGSKNALGSFFRTSYYYDISPSIDTTLEAVLSESDHLLLGGEWRQRFEDGRFQFNGALTRGDRKKIVGTTTVNQSDRWRGYVFSNGRFEINQDWRWGFDIQRTTDNSFLRRYNYSNADILRSSLFAEGFLSDRDYASIQAFDFQDLRPNHTSHEPLVFPLGQLSFMGDHGNLAGGRWALNISTVALERRKGTDSARFSGEVGWQRDFISSFGLVTTVNGTVRADVYSVSNTSLAPDPFTSSHPDHLTARLFPQGQIMARYPFARYGQTWSHTIEPLVAYTLSPPVDNKNIPNEDSQDVEFDTTNLFSTNHFPGVDRLEDGSRLTYGLRTAFYGEQLNFSAFVGQLYRFRRQTSLPENSGLEERHSDYVGSFHIDLPSYLDLDYKLRLDNTHLSSRRHDLALTAHVQRLHLNLNYINIHEIEGIVANGKREEISGTATIDLTNHWSFGVGHRRKLTNGSYPLYTGLNLSYHDECFGFETYLSHDNTVRADLKGGNSIYFRLVFKNLGAVETPTFSDGLLGNRTSENKAAP